jgi:hypothetical protein
MKVAINGAIMRFKMVSPGPKACLILDEAKLFFGLNPVKSKRGCRDFILYRRKAPKSKTIHEMPRNLTKDFFVSFV